MERMKQIYDERIALARKSLAPLEGGQMSLHSKVGDADWEDITLQRITELKEEIATWEKLKQSLGLF